MSTRHLYLDQIRDDRYGWHPEDRNARRGKPCQYGGCGVVHESAWHRSQRMWLCPFHTKRFEP